VAQLTDPATRDDDETPRTVALGGLRLRAAGNSFDRSDYRGQGGTERVIPTDEHDSHYVGGQVVFSQLSSSNLWKAA